MHLSRHFYLGSFSDAGGFAGATGTGVGRVAITRLTALNSASNVFSTVACVSGLT
jgi:hypothetical protein